MQQDSSFAPFETALDQETALETLRDAMSGTDDGELFLERRRAETLVFDDGHLKNASFDSAEGFGLRAVHGERAAYAHSSEISQAALNRAAQTVRLAKSGAPANVAPPPLRRNAQLYANQDPLLDAAFGSKITLLEEMNAYARAMDPLVVQVSISLSTAHQEVAILRPEGGLFEDARPQSRLNVSVIVEKDGRRESGSAGAGGRHGLSTLMTPDRWQPMLLEALRIAKINLEAVPAPAGQMDVVLGPGWPGILLHEAVGHGLEGDFNRKGSSAFSGRVGQQVASKGVTVVDDGTLPDRRGSLNFDDEGTPTNRTPLIEDGVLTGYMQDRQNARLMGVEPTGNGRRQSYAHAPMPRMTNTIMMGGNTAPSDILADLKDGLYAVGFGGGQVDITNGKFVFSCTEAYRVRNGIIGEPVKGATLIGDGPAAMQKIRALGNDMALDPGMGTCGKAGQWVPVGVGQPTVMIGGLTVGGSAL